MELIIILNEVKMIGKVETEKDLIIKLHYELIPLILFEEDEEDMRESFRRPFRRLFHWLDYWLMNLIRMN